MGLVTVSLDFIQTWSYIVRMNKFLSIQDAAKSLGVSPQTLRRWEKKKKIAPSHRTEGGNAVIPLYKYNPLIVVITSPIG